MDVDDRMLDAAREKVAEAEVLQADFTEWSAAREGRVFDAAVLMGGLLHLTDDRDLGAFAANVRDGLRGGGAFETFFEPSSDDVDNRSREVRTVESERFSVMRHATSALTSSAGHYTTTHLFVVRDERHDREARMGTVFGADFTTPTV